MSKSLEEIWQKMQNEKLIQRAIRENQEKKLYEAREKARQEYLQRNRMYENFVPTSAASSAVGSGGGSRQQSIKILTCSYFDGALYFVDRTGVVASDVQPFTGPVTFSDCQDDPDFIYYVTLDGLQEDPAATQSVFGKFNKNTFQRTDIDTVNLDSLTQDAPASLYYSGSNNFVYLVPQIESDSEESQLYQISINGDAILLSATANDTNLQAYGVCEFQGTTYVSVFDYGGLISALYTLDINTFDKELVDYFSMNVQTLPTGISNTKVLYVFDMAVYSGEIWANVVFVDKDVVYPYQCIGKINLETAEIDYYLPVSEGFGIALTSLVVY